MELVFEPGSIWGYVLVFLAAATPMVEVLIVIPAAILAGMAPLPVALLALAGNLATVALVVVAGDRGIAALRRWRAGRRAGPGDTPGASPGACGQAARADGEPGDSAAEVAPAHGEGRTAGARAATRPVGDPASARGRDGSAGRSGRAARLAQRWGVPGLALLGPGLTGSHVAALAALAVGARRGRVLAWMAIGLVAWVGPVTVLTLAGMGLFA
jgi:Ca2+/H+ antiporter, TMEM165/GDT1 family